MVVIKSDKGIIYVIRQIPAEVIHERVYVKPVSDVIV